ncbi:LacI family DNA-binding transcriptional regulator [Dactylosporangium vinaceum]|uniref:LacI family DNA-binding transcriptional regulator n=1 Tax=Dactylosporangium vinaceum TaxID=53362 RepID=A0ABV5MMY0_9ACTN|nr:LacI family DNA-binding transcriptional regulator [Dactylosporangium vinaceum]UAB98601.1 LacI family DNA-binding transcriptional regulator [Dactylosporangium vinaceum]
MGRVTLQTIADRVGVSRMTVSNAFSRPDQLSPTLRDRILAVADELGYVGPDPAARALARGTTGAVGILLTDSLSQAFSDEVATTFLGAIADELAPTGLGLTLLTTNQAGSVIPARDVAMDGALVYSCDPENTGVEWLLRRKIPLVFIDQNPADGVPAVNVADRAGARAAAQHLVDLGHRRVGIVTSGIRGRHGLIAPEDTGDVIDGFVADQRLTGWLDALTPAGITPVIARQPHGDPDSGYRAASELLKAGDPPTAIVCFSDALAQGVMEAAVDAGLTVPEDLSVVGFDDSPAAARMRPPLTTVRQDILAKGHAAAAALTRAIEATRTGEPQAAEHLCLPADLIVRASTAAPRA